VACNNEGLTVKLESSNDMLCLAQERSGQPLMMTIIDGEREEETGHWYSPAAVREMLAAEREQWRAALMNLCDAADATKYPLHGPAWDDLWNCAVAARIKLGHAGGE
jgi:hypothetical protein